VGQSATLLRKDEVLRIIGVNASTLWRWRKAGAFPAPFKVTRQTLRWRESDIANWLESHRRAEGGAN
jgi:predicted DNA-binding transcriptional regulator AlpA